MVVHYCDSKGSPVPEEGAFYLDKKGRGRAYFVASYMGKIVAFDMKGQRVNFSNLLEITTFVNGLSISKGSVPRTFLKALGINPLSFDRRVFSFPDSFPPWSINPNSLQKQSSLGVYIPPTDIHFTHKI